MRATLHHARVALCVWCEGASVEPSVERAVYCPRLSNGTESTYPASSGNANMALVLGILGLLGSVGACCCCLFWLLGLCAPAGWYVGSQELKAIRAGRSPASAESTAKAGMVCGIVGTVLMALYLVGILIYVAVVGGAVALETMKQGGLPLPK